MEVFLAILVVVGSLGGVLLGSILDRKARREERQAKSMEELRQSAAEVLGEAQIVLGAMAPAPGLLSGGAAEDEIEKRRIEADRVRPKVAVLSVLWREGADELETVERFMAYAPRRLLSIVDLVSTGHDQEGRIRSAYEQDHQAATDALSRAIGMLPRDS